MDKSIFNCALITQYPGIKASTYLGNKGKISYIPKETTVHGEVRW